MRSFLLYSRKGRTDSKFEEEKLVEAGRMDLVCRCIPAALWISHKARDDTKLFVNLNGPPRAPTTICFDGSKLVKVYVDEKMNARWIKKLLEAKYGKDWLDVKGSLVAKKSFQDIIKETKSNVYVLHEKGTPIEDVELKENPMFVMGDQIGLPGKEEGFALRKGEKISIGKNAYLVSNCIANLNWVCDQRGI
ncbi:MAG: tRNA (pseudouridine(54)-N(1))-methyltransferase TrmY [Candidatus Aenigmarchaeota archaeon]|nr:tRNA (pseudouridine(54)-N(1))-methyltransferase TrmY [Candidatus Aenigmarchaeota archaeon]